MSEPRKDDRLKHDVRTDGRLIVSYPKSGRTWVNFALRAAGIDATFTHAGSSTGWRDIGRNRRTIPAALLDVPVVFLHRDPIDTAVSMYYQVTGRDLRRGSRRWLRLWLPLALRRALPPRSIDDFVLHPSHGVERACAFNRMWLDHLSRRSDCLVLTYEEMRAEPATAFQRLLDHWGVTGASGADLAEASRFDRMRAAEQGDGNFLQHKATRSGGTAGMKVRRGKVRGYLDELDPATVDKCREIARKYGFDPA